MSRSNNTEITNPATRFFEWSGSEGKVKYYDKEAKENVYVNLPFTFLVLDTLVTLTGYSDDTDSGYWSNEVRNIKTETFTVRTKKGVAAEGYYDDVKDLTGIKYTQSVYIAFKDGEELKVGNLKLHGSAIGPWIEFRKGKNIYDGAISIVNKHEAKKGKNKYFEPVFETKTTSEETDEAAKDLDKDLQEYLKTYFSRNGHAQVPEEEKPTLQSVALAATAANDELKRIGTGFGAYGHAAGIPEPSDPFGEMSIPDTEPAFDEELEADAKKKDDDIPF